MKIFEFFKVTKKQRENVQEPKNAKTWLIHGISEFIGTFILTMGLAGLSTVAKKDGTEIEHFFGHPALIGFYAGFGVVGFVLFVFLRWSCDLNPAVTLYRMFNGTNTHRYGIYKMVIQFTSAILTGMLIYVLGHAHDAPGGVANHAITLEGVASKFKSWEGSQTDNSVVTLVIFAAEFVITMILLFSIFSKSINEKYRDLMIMFIIAIDVYLGMIAGTAAINPARGLAQQVPGLFFGHEAGGAASAASIELATMGMLLGTTLAPFGYLFIQGVSEHYINPFVKNVIGFKNNKMDNMRTGSNKQ